MWDRLIKKLILTIAAFIAGTVKSKEDIYIRDYLLSTMYTRGQNEHQ